jgi:hypothetical protein
MQTRVPEHTWKPTRSESLVSVLLVKDLPIENLVPQHSLYS